MTRKKSKKSKVVEPGVLVEVKPAELEFPAWFYRVSCLMASRKLEEKRPSDWCGPYWADFDEDISDIGPDDDHECICVSDESLCECNPVYKNLSSTEEGRRYADYKNVRDYRRRELDDWRKDREEEAKEVKAEEEKVETARRKAQKRRTKGKKGQRLDLEEAHFDLFSSEYTNSLPLEYDHPGTSIRFREPEEYCWQEDVEGTSKSFECCLHHDGGCILDSKPFRAPKRAKATNIQICGREGEGSVNVTFIDSCHIQVVIPRSILEPQPPAPTGPESFTFVGTVDDIDTRKARRRRREDKAVETSRKQRETSPRESWFEMNHPMGWWAQSRWGSLS